MSAQHVEMIRALQQQSPAVELASYDERLLAAARTLHIPVRML